MDPKLTVAGLGLNSSILSLHDLATSSPLQLSAGSTAALARVLETAPANAAVVTLTATDVNGGEIGVAVAMKKGDHWTVGAVFDWRKNGPEELGFRLQYNF